MKTNSKVFRAHLFMAAVFALVSTVSAFAEHGPGNSGNAVERDGKYYLLDFVEAGIEEKPNWKIVDGRIENSLPRVKDWAINLLTDFEMNDRILIGEELRRLEFVSPYTAAALLFSIKLHSWSFVNYPLKDITEDDSSIAIPPENLHQLAVRRGNSIQIRKQFWDKMDGWNRVGTVFHETFFSFAKVEKDKNGDLIQKSWGVRQIVGQFFKAGWDLYGIWRAIHVTTENSFILPFLDNQAYTKKGMSDITDLDTSIPISVWYGDREIKFSNHPTARLKFNYGGGNSSVNYQVGYKDMDLRIAKIKDGLRTFCEMGEAQNGVYTKSDLYSFDFQSYDFSLRFSSYSRNGESLNYLELKPDTISTRTELPGPKIETVEECVQETIRTLKRENENILDRLSRVNF